MAALVAAGALAFGPAPVSAAGQVSPTTNADDGSAGSLRFILENLADATTTVVLPAGTGPYMLTNCGAGDININDVVVIEGNGNTIQQTCTARVLQTNSNLTLRNVIITGGNTGGQGAGLDFDGGDTLTIDGGTFVGNMAGNDGGALNVNTEDTPATITVNNSTFATNQSGDDGGAIDLNTGPVALKITASTFNGNSSNDMGGAIATEDDNTAFTIVNSTITGNTSGTEGAIDNSEGNGDDVTLVYDTITDNIAGPGAGAAANAASGDHPPVHAEASNTASLTVDGAFTSFGSVITGPVGGPNCDLTNAQSTSSLGYNFSDDATCSLTNTAAGDRETAGDPGLGALANNGGPTQTQLPTATSPLLNFIPIAACGGGNAAAGFAVTTDQRGITRPQATGCEVGSVEVLVVLVVARFTG